ncbi:MAG TPA: hypothetical protein DCK95_12045 [Anaerolineaceae bacterium]|nr:hypothetical protein [Anaerolineaceae bacterium]
MLHEEERAAFIAERVEKSKTSTENGTYTLSGWRGSELTLPIMMLDNKFMAYTISDPRTASMHFQYGREHPEAGLFFFNNGDDEKVQRAQEEIILYLVKNRFLGEAILENPVVRGREPVVITSKGYIVKGNISVAILREIGEQMLYCVVLPDDATQDEINKFDDQC